MRQAGDREWKVVDLKREMLRRGWAPTPKAVEGSVKRLREAGQIDCVSYGHYKLAQTESDESEGVRAGVDPAPSLL
jgi:hypothetical protein